MIRHIVVTFLVTFRLNKFTRFCVSEIDAYLVVNYRAYLELSGVTYLATVALWIELAVFRTPFTRTPRALPASQGWNCREEVGGLNPPAVHVYRRFFE